MIGAYKIFTITHHNTSLQDIQRFFIHPERLNDELSGLKDSCNIAEILYLATCNRVCYLVYDEKDFDENRIQDFFYNINPDLKNEDWSVLRSSINYYVGKSAVKHLFELASSINSMVIGEREIFRQLREAYDFSKDTKLSGDNIRLLMRFTVEAAKCVYANTAIGEKPLSVVALAFREMMLKSPDRDARILMVGSGQTNTLYGKFLSKHQFTNVSVFNRNKANAEILAKQLGGSAYSLEDLSTYNKGFDILIVCTASLNKIIHPALYEQLIGTDGAEKVLIDLSVPQNIDPLVIKNYPTHHVEVESLKDKAKENLQHRVNEIEAVQAILTDFLYQFEKAFKQRILERALHHVPAEIKLVKHRALNMIFAKEVDTLDDTTKELIERMMNYMEKGCINIPMKAAKTAFE